MIAICGLLYGAVAAFIIQRLVRRSAVGPIVNRMLAHVLEFRLFIDEPRTVFRAQRDLLRENGRLLRAIAWPFTLATLPAVLLYATADRYLGTAALRPGETAVLTLPISAKPAVPPGVVTETAGVRVARTGTVSWRVRAVSPNNTLGRRPWLLWFSLFSAAGAILQTTLRIRRVTPKSVSP